MKYALRNEISSEENNVKMLTKGGKWKCLPHGKLLKYGFPMEFWVTFKIGLGIESVIYECVE